MCKSVILTAIGKQLYKGPRGGLYWLDEKGKKHYVRQEAATSDRCDKTESPNQDSISGCREDEVTCPFDKKGKILVKGVVCEECWFQEQLKLKGGQYL